MVPFISSTSVSVFANYSQVGVLVSRLDAAAAQSEAYKSARDDLELEVEACKRENENLKAGVCLCSNPCASPARGGIRGC